MKKTTHHTVSFAFPLSPPEAPAALGAGGMPLYCDMNVEVDTVVVPILEPATFALEGSGVDLVMGEAEPRDAEGLYEKGGKIGKSVVATSDGYAVVGVRVVRDREAEPEVDSDGPSTLVEVAAGEVVVADRDGDGSTATELVIAVVGVVDRRPNKDVGRGPGTVMLIITTVVTVVVLVEKDL